MNALDILNNKINSEPLSDLLKIYIVDAMRAYAKLKCSEQRELCSEHSELSYNNEDCTDSGLNESAITIDKESIINSPEPNFD
jgi:hypothetical protein